LARRIDLYLKHTTRTRERLLFFGGIRTRNPNKSAAADPRFRTRGHWVGEITAALKNVFLTTVFCDKYGTVHWSGVWRTEPDDGVKNRFPIRRISGERGEEGETQGKSKNNIHVC